MATSYFQDPFGAADYSAEGMPSLLSLSNLESLGRGSFAGLLGLPEDLRKALTSKKMQENMDFVASQSGIPQVPYFLPSSEELKQRTPRMTAPTPQTGLLEDIGAFMSPVPAAAAVKPLARGGKALGKAYLKEIDAAMMGERGGLLGAITPQPKLLDVYHGTPHTLPPTERNPLGEFDASKIGSGEGSQAYGYGIYTAESPAVAKEYQKVTGLVNPIFQVGDVQISPVNNPTTTFDKLKNFLYNNAVTNIVEGDKRLTAKQLLNESFYDLDYNFTGNELITAKKELTKLIESKGKKILQIPKGNLYKADLPDEMIPKMLDYDKHMSEQSLEVQKILLPYQKEIGGSFGTGEQTLKAIAFERRMKGLDDSPAAVAEQLRRMGIPGVKYLDAQSRSMPNITNKRLADLYQKNQGNAEATVDEFMRSVYNTPKKKAEMRKQFLKELETPKTRNFVTFPGEEKSMTILERNGMTGLLD